MYGIPKECLPEMSLFLKHCGDHWFVRDSTGFIGCDANIEPEEISNSTMFPKLEAAIVASVREAGTYRASERRGLYQ